MLAFYRNISILLVFTVFISSCNTLQIESPGKQKVAPGLPTEVAMVKYSFTIVTTEDLAINSISLVQNENQSIISNYTVIHLTDGKILNAEASLSKGSYYVSFKNTDGDLDINKSDVILLEYTVSGKTKTKVIKPELMADLLMK